MSHKVDSMAYVGETPWHGLGVNVPKGATVGAMRKAAGLMWEPELHPLSYTHGRKTHEVPERVMVRDDTGARLDTVGPDYVPIKQAEVIEFFRAYCEAGDMHLETLGALDGGRYVWALAKMDASFALGRDRVEGYVTLVNPHRYGKSAMAMFTGVRIVCWNTLQMALSANRDNGGERVTIWHVAEFNADRRAEVQAEMGIARESLAALREDAQAMAACHLSDKRAQALLVKVFGKAKAPDAPKDFKWEDAPRAVSRTFVLYKGEAKGATLPSAKDTAWGLLNAVTQYVDWERGRTQEKRLERSWFGSGSRLKERARQTLRDVALA